MRFAMAQMQFVASAGGGLNLRAMA
jgi:hypothetical protein